MTGSQPDKACSGNGDGFRRLKLALKRPTGREPGLKTDLRLWLERFGAWRICTGREFTFLLKSEPGGVA